MRNVVRISSCNEARRLRRWLLRTCADTSNPKAGLAKLAVARLSRFVPKSAWIGEIVWPFTDGDQVLNGSVLEAKLHKGKWSMSENCVLRVGAHNRGLGRSGDASAQSDEISQPLSETKTMPV